jgi:dethiobiotin synthetase
VSGLVPATGLFVTATGTGVGKTLVAAALLHQLRARGERTQARKPVLSGWPDPAGEPSDAEILLRAQGIDPTLERVDEIAPWRFRAPLSPDMAAAREGRSLDFDALVAFTRDARSCARGAGFLLVEGVGGVAVPLDARHTVLDWIAASELPALLVAGSYLGTLSHTLTAGMALRQRGVALAGLVISESPESPVPLSETRATLLRFLGPLPCAEIPRLASGPEPWRRVPPLLAALGFAPEIQRT